MLRQVGYRAFLININLQKIRYAAGSCSITGSVKGGITKFGKTLIGALLVGILVLAPSAYGISISVYGDTGGFMENIHAGARDSVYGSAAIGPGSFSNSIRGSGSLLESHWVSNSAGSSAGVGVDIRKAESYDYGYTLTPGIGSFWKASIVLH